MGRIIDLISYIRSINIEPECKAKSLADNLQHHGINFPINYDLNLNNFFHSKCDTEGQWWEVNLKTLLYITSYKIIEGHLCYWVDNWKIEASKSGLENDYEVIHSYNKYSYGQLFKLSKPILLQFFRITGYSTKCENKNCLVFKRIYLYGYPIILYKITKLIPILYIYFHLSSYSYLIFK